MNLVQVVFLAGAHCLSPIAQAPGLTEAGKVACAVLIQFVPATSDVAILPALAAPDALPNKVEPAAAKTKRAGASVRTG